MDSRLSRENAKGRVLTALNKGSLNNAQIREITQLSRQQVTRLMNELRTESGVVLRGKNKAGRWFLPGEHKI